VEEPAHFVRIGRITGPYKVEPQAAFAVIQLGAHQYKVRTVPWHPASCRSASNGHNQFWQ
jgi:hypothetical protein